MPLPTAADDHQRKNAEVLVVGWRGGTVEQKTLTGAVLAARMTALLGNPQRLAEMSASARRLARPDAARVIADKALELADARARHSVTDSET